MGFSLRKAFKVGKIQELMYQVQVELDLVQEGKELDFQ